MTDEEELMAEIEKLYSEVEETEKLFPEEAGTCFVMDIRPGDFIEFAGEEYFVSQFFYNDKLHLASIFLRKTATVAYQKVLVTLKGDYIVKIRRNQ